MSFTESMDNAGILPALEQRLGAAVPVMALRRAVGGDKGCYLIGGAVPPVAGPGA